MNTVRSNKMSIVTSYKRCQNCSFMRNDIDDKLYCMFCMFFEFNIKRPKCTLCSKEHDLPYYPHELVKAYAKW